MLNLIIAFRRSSFPFSSIVFKRHFSGGNNRHFVKFLKNLQQSHAISGNPTNTRNVLSAITICIIGLTFLAIPLYEIFCQKSGYLGTPQIVTGYSGLSVPPKNSRNFQIDFVSHSNISWDFSPCQDKVIVKPGETTLVFYKAKNLQSRPIIGIASYNIIPDEAGQYFNKIQCFCFEEQMLNPYEELELPVFFYLDPNILDDPRLESVNHITLSYTFFESDADIPEDYKLLQLSE